MDRVGRVPVIAGGFGVGASGACWSRSGAPDASLLVIVGFGAVGAMNGAVLAGAHRRGRHGPPERRARAISYVLFGALFGAALGPLVFRPLFAGKDLELDALVVPWLVAAGNGAGRRGRGVADSAGPAHDRPRVGARRRPGHAGASGTAPEILRRPGFPRP